MVLDHILDTIFNVHHHADVPTHDYVPTHFATTHHHADLATNHANVEEKLIKN